VARFSRLRKLVGVPPRWVERPAPVRLGLICGSLRKESTNLAALLAARRLARSFDQRVVTTVVRVGALPLFDVDLEQAGEAPSVTQIRRQVHRADCLLFASADYNGGPSGALKNALDWLSRPPGQAPVTGKPVAVIAASSMPEIDPESIRVLLRILHRMGARPIAHPPLPIPSAREALDGRGGVNDAAVEHQLRSVAAALLNAVTADRAVLAP
jgi:chromate reductase